MSNVPIEVPSSPTVHCDACSETLPPVQLLPPMHELEERHKGGPDAGLRWDLCISRVLNCLYSAFLCGWQKRRLGPP